jgi:hypothetical protein
MSRVVTFSEIILRFSPPGNLRFLQARSFDVVYGGVNPTWLSAILVHRRCQTYRKSAQNIRYIISSKENP